MCKKMLIDEVNTVHVFYIPICQKMIDQHPEIKLFKTYCDNLQTTKNLEYSLVVDISINLGPCPNIWDPGPQTGQEIERELHGKLFRDSTANNKNETTPYEIDFFFDLNP